MRVRPAPGCRDCRVRRAAPEARSPGWPRPPAPPSRTSADTCPASPGWWTRGSRDPAQSRNASWPRSCHASGQTSQSWLLSRHCTGHNDLDWAFKRLLRRCPPDRRCPAAPAGCSQTFLSSSSASQWPLLCAPAALLTQTPLVCSLCPKPEICKVIKQTFSFQVRVRGV